MALMENTRRFWVDRRPADREPGGRGEDAVAHHRTRPTSWRRISSGTIESARQNKGDVRPPRQKTDIYGVG
jgi:hypothetical protein